MKHINPTQNKSQLQTEIAVRIATAKLELRKATDLADEALAGELSAIGATLQRLVARASHFGGGAQ